ncbi:MAG: hypothetical protein DRP08_04145 [Candidatus Aenigmatarchaeota archaeon]|nr:MAG: hypothetical protein DRP08_04145 [Candidatus Aenigmarchaeota archaeon]
MAKKKRKKSTWRGKKTYPARGVPKKTRSRVVKAARKGKDIGKKGKMFKKISAKAARRYGSKEAGERVAGSTMWKIIKKRSRKKTRRKGRK